MDSKSVDGEQGDFDLVAAISQGIRLNMKTESTYDGLIAHRFLLRARQIMIIATMMAKAMPTRMGSGGKLERIQVASWGFG
jgi:hypothetical protein